MSHRMLRGAAIAAIVGIAPVRSEGQESVGRSRQDSVPAPDSVVYLTTINVTATRSELTLFETPAAVSVLRSATIRDRNPTNISELFLDLPGLDAEGVGAAQRKPMIRGMLGQRVLLLEDGLRLNNTRRQQDRGETPSLVDPSRIERVEIVRGASSVLYGSDAVGGVVNIITRGPSDIARGGVRGTARVSYGTAGSQKRTSLGLNGNIGRFSIGLDGSYRDASPYRAPGGSFGGFSLAATTRVNDTGVEDYTLGGAARYRFDDRHSVTIKHTRYHARNAGFGFVDPGALGTADATLQLLFPDQVFRRTSLHYDGTSPGFPLADRVRIAGYYQSNEREFDTSVSGPLGPPGATLDVRTVNFTDIDTYGFRVEARKVLHPGVALTYGSDLFRDGSRNTDTSTTTITGLGPTVVRSRGTRVPNATFTSLGMFLQSEFHPHERVEFIVGGRWQEVHAGSEPTPGITNPLVSSTDRNLVGAANLLLRISRRFHLVGSVGRAFRSPNLVERFFEGPSPEGRGFWILNPDLRAETSFNREIGVKYLGPHVEAEGYLFANSVFDGIRGVATGNLVGTSPELRNENIDELSFAGLDLTVTASLGRGFHATFGYSHLNATIDTSAVVPSAPFGEGYSDKVVAGFGFRDRSGRFNIEYSMRHTASRDGVELVGSTVGVSAPSFTVHSAIVGFEVFPGQTISVSAHNLFDVLYAESTNISFFRPEPGRNVTVTARVEF